MRGRPSGTAAGPASKPWPGKKAFTGEVERAVVVSPGEVEISMEPRAKGKSPFYPGQPVPIELFVGRRAQIEHVLERGAAQVAAGKPVAVYVQGEYGIGKSSIAGFLQHAAEERCHLHGIYAPLGAADDLAGVGTAVLEATIRSGVFKPARSEKIRTWLAKYIGD